MTYDKTELNSFVQNLYDEKMREGKHGHYESMFHVVHKAIAKVALAEPSEPIEPNNDEVICQKCAHQFRAIPVNVQKLLMGKGIDPPFTHPASKPDAPLLRTFLDEAKKEGITHISLKMGKPAPLPELTDEELMKCFAKTYPNDYLEPLEVMQKTQEWEELTIFARAILAAAREKAK